MTRFVLLLSFSFVSVISFIALVHRAYRDNLLQFFGLWGIVFGGVSKIVHILSDRVVYDNGELVVFVLGVALFMAGTAIKVIRHARSPHGTD